MNTEIRKFPSNLKANLGDKIKQLETAIPILNDHIQQFGPQIQKESPRAYILIAENIQLLKRELELRLFTKNFTNLYQTIKLKQGEIIKNESS